MDEMTPAELSAALIFRMRYDERLNREGWEQARVVSFYAMAPHLKKGTVSGYKDLFTLAWDKDEESKETRILTPDDFTEDQRRRIIADLRKDGF